MQKVRFTMRALIQRINRKIAPQNQVLKKTRGAQAQIDLGGYFVLDQNANAVVRKNVDPVAFAKSLKALEAFETVVDE